MKHWLRRGGYLIVFVVWLMIMCLPTLAFVLATRGEIQIGEYGRRNLRIFMVQEEESQGIGFQFTRPLSQNDNCWQTAVNYLLWQGNSEEISSLYCQCLDPGSSQLVSSGTCP